MSGRLSYFVFPFAVLFFAMSILYPENISSRLGTPISETSRIVHLSVLCVVVIGAAYLCVKQVMADLKARKAKRGGLKNINFD